MNRQVGGVRSGVQIGGSGSKTSWIPRCQPKWASPLQSEFACDLIGLETRSASDPSKTNKLCIIYVFAGLTRAMALQYVTFILRP